MPPNSNRDGSFAKPWPLEAKRHLLTERERALYQRLVQTLPGHIVLAQVQLVQVINFQRGRRTQAILNRFNQLSLDFLVLNPDTSIVAAIELDDSTHAREARRCPQRSCVEVRRRFFNPVERKELAGRSNILAAIPTVASGARGDS